MPYDPFEWLPVGRTAVRTMRLGFGAGSIGGLYAAVSDDEGDAMVRHAWDIGVRTVDTAPFYGFGLAETRLGRLLGDVPRDAFTISTKVGRVLVPVDASNEHDTGNWHGCPPLRAVFDFSRDAVLRSLESSLERLRLDRVDILFIHDPDDHWQAAIDEAYPALHDLRSQGVVGAIGAGMNQVEMLARFAREADMDVFLVAGRYTILDQSALPELMPLCQEKGIGVVIGGVMNSGILVDPVPGARFNYEPASQAWLDRAMRLKAVCDRHDVPLRSAAIRFPLAHPAVCSVAAGVRTAAHLDDYVDAMRREIPSALWEELRAEGLVAEGAPTPV
jgi:D-threo-aldose 1-dehydrogenase